MEEQKRVEETLNNLLDTIDNNYMRKMQADMYRCAAQCYERPNSSRDNDQHCYNKCTSQVNRAMAVVSHCLEEYQTTLRNCLETCADSVRYTSEYKAGNLTTEMENKLTSCSKTCVDSFIGKKLAVLDKVTQMLKADK